MELEVLAAWRPHSHLRFHRLAERPEFDLGLARELIANDRVDTDYAHDLVYG